MAFVRFDHKRDQNRQALDGCVTIAACGMIRISQNLFHEVCPGAAFVSLYFDESTSSVAVSPLLEKPEYSVLKLYRPTGGSRQAIGMSGRGLLKKYHIATCQYHIPATIETIDGKKMIVFSVKRTVSRQ